VNTLSLVVLEITIEYFHLPLPFIILFKHPDFIASMRNEPESYLKINIKGIRMKRKRVRE
jgi:hypothetical protein